MRIIEALNIIRACLTKGNTQTNSGVVNTNIALVNLYKEHSKNEFYLDINGVENLIKKIVVWYKEKYTPDVIDLIDRINMGFENENFINCHEIFEQLKSKFSNEELKILKCNYDSGYSYDRFDPITLERKEYVIINAILYEEKIIFGIEQNGVILPLHLQMLFTNIINNPNATTKIDQLYDELIELRPDNSNLFELKKCVDRHHLDLALRKQILYAVANNLMHSNSDCPCYNYKRASIFKDEFYNEFGIINPNDIKTETGYLQASTCVSSNNVIDINKYIKNKNNEY